MRLAVVTTIFAFVSAALAATHTVTIGLDGLGYDPPYLTGVAAGDVIDFQFTGFLHSVTQSTFSKPCTPKLGGIDSGQKTTGSYSYTVRSTAPHWFHCSVPTHCSSGMVFAINPTAEKTYAAFMAKAMGQ